MATEDGLKKMTDLFKVFEPNGSPEPRPLPKDGFCQCGRPAAEHLRSSHFDSQESAEDTHANIPARFRWAKLDSTRLAERVSPPRVISAVGEHIVEGKRLFVLHGSAGAGKTSLGCAMLRNIAKRDGITGHFADAIDLAYARKMHPLGQGEAPEVSEAMRAKVLFLDELGAEQGADQTIEQIIRRRHNTSLPTIYGTPHTADALRKRYGDGVTRRIFEGATVIHMAGIGKGPTQ